MRSRLPQQRESKMFGTDLLQLMAIIGYLGVFYRAFFTLSIEFNESDEVVKQPFNYAASASIHEFQGERMEGI